MDAGPSHSRYALSGSYLLLGLFYSLSGKLLGCIMHIIV